MARKYPLVCIEWLDAETDSSWKDEEEIMSEEMGAPVTTVGFLIRKPSKKFHMYMVASTVSFGAYTLHNAITKIPKQWVKSITEIKEENNNEKDRDSGPPPKV